MSERLPRIVLAVLIVGLAVHNLAMAELWDAGIRGGCPALVTVGRSTDGLPFLTVCESRSPALPHLRVRPGFG